jgi:hypothetical protein
MKNNVLDHEKILRMTKDSSLLLEKINTVSKLEASTPVLHITVRLLSLVLFFHIFSANFNVSIKLVFSFKKDTNSNMLLLRKVMSIICTLPMMNC